MLPVKVYRINPEFSILRLTILKILKIADCKSFSDLLSVYQKTIDNLALKAQITTAADNKF